MNLMIQGIYISIMENKLYIIVPCYNEDKVIDISAPELLKKLNELIALKYVDASSRILFVDDGSKDSTWYVINKLCESDIHFCGISLSKNRGHQNALVAGLMEARNKCDFAISIDCDGQDDINAMNAMIEEYMDGAEIVYGVRSKRTTDTMFKRISAQAYYKLLMSMGVEVIYNHADFRLTSNKVLNELSKYNETNIYLRGMMPLIGFKSTSVYYSREKRVAGEKHYSLKKMCELALDGITGFTIKPLRMVAAMGIFMFLIALLSIIVEVIIAVCGNSVDSLAYIISTIFCMGGIQLICTGILGEYIGKIYSEVKHRPLYIIKDYKNINDNEL